MAYALVKTAFERIRAQTQNGAADNRGAVGQIFLVDVRCERSPPHSDLSMFQKIGVAGPSSTPVSDLRHALGPKYWPSGM